VTDDATQQPRSTDPAPQEFAAVDLGSNSFHMVVAHARGGQVDIIDRLRERVQLAAGLTEDGGLDGDARERAIACLARFGQRVAHLENDAFRAVGTNTLRRARAAGDFIEEAEAALGHPIEIISGAEEARLIYQGVRHSLERPDSGRQLVVDIGGGSTEVIVGEGRRILRANSLQMGCVSWSLRFFADGAVQEEEMRLAEVNAALELRPIRYRYRELGWEAAVGSSGTILSIANVLRSNGWGDGSITRDGLLKLRTALVDFGHVDAIKLPGLSADRQGVIAGGLAVLVAIFDSFKVKRMTPASGALREGLLFDLLGRIEHSDVRDDTVHRVGERYAIDRAQADRVERAALSLLNQVDEDWHLEGDRPRDFLRWASRLHEIGLSIAHSGYHKHGAYIVRHGDFPGFSRTDQDVLAALIRLHRRRGAVEELERVPPGRRKQTRRLAALLRLAVRLSRNRSNRAQPPVRISAKKNRIQLRFPDEWLERHPLTRADFEDEIERLAGLNFELSID
jgi:exopolyphosphatase/guanosine-5'-triphosphate,3'-diphosphate pyrophosphatase